MLLKRLRETSARPLAPTNRRRSRRMKLQVRFGTVAAAGRGLLLMGLGCLLLGPLPMTHAEDLGTPDWLRDQLGQRLSHRRDNGAMMRLVEPLVQRSGQATVQVLSDGKPVAMGAVVSADGLILTKRSELSANPLRVRLADGRMLPARIAAIRRAVDLALLQVEGVETLPFVKFASEEPSIGSFLVSVGRGDRPIGLGVMGVPSRRIDHVGRLGVVLRNDNDGFARVDGVWPDSGADEAGVKPGDRIVGINGRDESGQQRVIRALNGMYPGETVRLTIQRDEGKLEVDAEIRDFRILQETENDARVNGARSMRLSGFESALQHDTVLEPDQCGGPVVDSQGRVVGLNIARAGRVVSYALPGKLVAEQLKAMKAELQRDDS